MFLINVINHGLITVPKPKKRRFMCGAC